VVGKLSAPVAGLPADLQEGFRLGADIAVSTHDVGPNLQAAASIDRIPFHVL